MSDFRCRLAQGTQVREEEFGLLFYTMAGPRLYFLSSGCLLGKDFFNGSLTLSAWLAKHEGRTRTESGKARSLEIQLKRLTEKGVLIEC